MTVNTVTYLLCAAENLISACWERFNDASPDDIVQTTLYYRRLQLFCHRQKNLQYLAFQLQDIFSFS